MVTQLRADDRGQGHTLEAIVSGFLLLAAVAFALQMTAVTPLSASTSSQHVENQLQSAGSGVLASTAETGALSEIVRYWNATGDRFHDTPARLGYYSGPPDTAFGEALNRTFNDRNVAYNVRILYQDRNGTIFSQRLIWQGQPSDHAVRASRTVAIADDDYLVDADGSLNTTTVLEAGNDQFYMPDAAVDPAGGNRGLYNLVRVEVVAWRI